MIFKEREVLMMDKIVDETREQEGVDNTGSEKNAGCRQQIVFVMTLLQ